VAFKGKYCKVLLSDGNFLDKSVELLDLFVEVNWLERFKSVNDDLIPSFEIVFSSESPHDSLKFIVSL